MTSRSKTFFFFFFIIIISVIIILIVISMFAIFSPTHLRQTNQSSGDRHSIQMALSEEYNRGGGKKKKRAHNNNNSNDNNNNKGTEACGANTLMRVRTLIHNRDRPRTPHHSYTEGFF